MNVLLPPSEHRLQGSTSARCCRAPAPTHLSAAAPQAVVLRTLHVLLLQHPGWPALQLGPRQAELLELVARVGAAARRHLDQQHQPHGPSKDLFMVHQYSLTVLAATVEDRKSVV